LTGEVNKKGGEESGGGSTCSRRTDKLSGEEMKEGVILIELWGKGKTRKKN